MAAQSKESGQKLGEVAMSDQAGSKGKQVIHQSRQFSRWGGTMFTTLCGRMRTTNAGMNIGKKVTCKLCLKRKRVGERGSR